MSFRLFLRLADETDLREIGVRGPVAREAPVGRGHLAPHGREIQVALCGPADLEIAAAHDDAENPPFEVGVLSADIAVESIAPPARLGDEQLWIPLGLRNVDLQTAGFRLGLGDHAMIAGPGRSGKTAALMSIGAQLCDPSLSCTVRWYGNDCPGEGIDPIDAPGLARLLGYASNEDRRTIILIDDVELTTDAGEFAAVLADRESAVHLIVAGRVDRLRNAYGHWTNEFKQSRRGVLLWPDVLDGDVVGVDLPSRIATSAVPGRGVLVQDGQMAELQLARH